MQRTHRFRFVIFAMFACAILLSIAAFSVSWAAWSGGEGNASVTVDGQSGQFYVSYPRYAGDEIVDQLDSNTYYLYTKKTDGTVEYYEMQLNTGNTDEQMVTNVYLTSGTVFNVYKGKTANGITGRNSASTGRFVYSSSTASVTADGYYDFYYVFQNTNAKTMYASYRAYVSNANDYDRIAEDLGYTIGPFYVDYNDNTTRKMYFRLAPGASGNFASSDQFSMYIWYEGDGSKTEYYEYGNAPKRVSSTYGFHLDNGQKLPLDQDTRVIFAFGGDGSWNNQTDDLYLSNYSKEETNFITLHAANKTSSSYSDPTYDGYATTTEIKAAVPLLYRDEDVREVNGTVNEDNSYTYSNYVCVSRVLGANDRKEKTIAYVNFYVDGNDSDLNTRLISFIVKRTKTDANGNPISGSEDPFVYNDPSGKTLRDISYVSSEDDPDKPTSGNFKDDYIVGGAYIMLYFGEDAEQYYALDVTIETESAASFTLTATASNVNNRDRFEDGYGNPYGYYLGGEFNGVNLWEPRKAARLTANDGHGDEAAVELTYYDNGEPVTATAPQYIDVSIEIELTAVNDTVKLYRLNGVDGKYVGGDSPTLWFIPKTIYKNYTGGAGTGGTDLFNKDMNIIIRNPGTYLIRYVGNVQYRDKNADGTTDATKNNSIFAYDREENVFMSETRYNALSDTERSSTIHDDGRNVDELRYVTLGNWNGVVDSLYVTKLSDSELTTEIDVTFNANGGTFEEGETITTKVKWGGTVKEPDEKPTRAGFDFDGWYTAADGGEKYTFTETVTDDTGLILYAGWIFDADVVYYYNYDGAPDDVYHYEGSVLYGSALTRPADPTRPSENWAGTTAEFFFGGWYTNPECTDDQFWNFTNNTYKGEPIELYARWHIKNDYAQGGSKQGWYVVVNGVPYLMHWFANAYDYNGEEFIFYLDAKQGDEIRFFVDGDTPAYKFDYAETVAVAIENPVEGKGVYGVAQADGWVRLHFKATNDHNTAELSTFNAGDIKVTFDPNGGTLAFGTYPVQGMHNDINGGKIYRPADPSKAAEEEGKLIAFLGWVVDGTNDLWDFSQPVTQNMMTLKAKWSNPFDGWSLRINDDADLIHLDNVYDRNTVILNDAVNIVGGGYNSDVYDVIGYAEVSTTLTRYTRIYLYQGHNQYSKVVSYGGDVLDPTNDTANGDDYVSIANGKGARYSILVAQNKSTGLMTVYMVATVTFNTNGGSLADGESSKRIVAIASTVSQPTDPTLNGYDFEGWYTDNNTFNNRYNFSTSVSANTTLYANWGATAVIYELDYNYNGGSKDPNANYPTEYVEGGTITIPNPVAPAGRRFVSWSLGQGGAVLTNNNQITPNDVAGLDPSTKITLFANYEYVVVTFVDDADIYTGGPMTVNDSGKLNSIPEPTRQHYSFDGWFKSGETSKITTDTVFTDDTTVYAKWTALSYTITLNANSGTLAGSTTYLMTVAGTGKLASMPSNPTRDFYDFSKWTTPAGDTVSTSTVFYGATEITAQWTIKSAGLYINKEFKASMTTNSSNSSEQMVTGVDLSSGDVIDIIYGGAVVTYSRNTSSTTKVTYNTSNSHYSVSTPFLFDFYYNTSSKVLYIGEPSAVRIQTTTDSKYIYVTVSGSNLTNLKLYAFTSSTTNNGWPGVAMGSSSSLSGNLSALQVIPTWTVSGWASENQTTDISYSWTSGYWYTISITGSYSTWQPSYSISSSIPK